MLANYHRYCRPSALMLGFGCVLMALSLLACDTTKPAPPTDTGAATDTSTVDTLAPEDTASPPADTMPAAPDPCPGCVALPKICEAPETLPEPSIVMEKFGDAMTHVSHIVDTEPDPENGLVYGVGFPGFTVFAYDEDDALKHVGIFPTDNWWIGGDTIGDVGEFNYIEPLGDNIVAITARGVKPPWGIVGDRPAINGLFFLDVSDPTWPVQVGYLDLPDLSGVVRRGNLMYIAAFSGMFYIVDISDVTKPAVIKAMPLFKNAWSIWLEGDFLYVADNKRGIVTIDLEEPEVPKIASKVSTASGIQDLVVRNGYLYAAVGAPGIEVFTLEDPAKPKSVGLHYVSSASAGVSATDTHLWYVNNEGVGVFDISEPSQPKSLAYMDTPGWALGVWAFGNQAYVADWESVTRYRLLPEILAPHNDAYPDNLYFQDVPQSWREVRITNRGGATLEILGAKINDPRFSVETPTTEVAPGETVTMIVKFEDDGKPVKTDLCLVTNDPIKPLRWIRVDDTSAFVDGAHVGDPASDFVLPDIETGQQYTLSDHFGQPIYLCFFSTW